MVDPGRMTFPEWWAKVMPPLWQYFSRLRAKRQTSPSLPPKGANRGPLRPFPLQTGRFLGSHDGGHDGDRGLLWPAPLRGSPAVWAKAMPPLWQYFLRLLAHLRAIPAPSMFGLTMRFAATRRGGGGAISPLIATLARGVLRRCAVTIAEPTKVQYARVSR
jgi:hypothetical protein